jgi:hypothetical protein
VNPSTRPKPVPNPSQTRPKPVPDWSTKPVRPVPLLRDGRVGTGSTD